MWRQRPGESAFSGWTAPFTDPRLCAASAGRLTFDAHIINTTQARRQSATTG